MRHAFRSPARLFAVLLLVAAAAVLAACGSSSSSSGDDANKILADTFSSGKQVKSGKLDLELNLDLQGVKSLNGPASVKLTGPFQSAGTTGELPDFDFVARLALGGQNFEAGAVSTGDKGFVRFQGQSYSLSDKLFASFKQGYKQAQQKNANKGKSKQTTLQSLGIDPQRWLKDATVAGDETVGNADTTHITANIDVAKFLDDVNTVLGRAGGISVAGSQPRAVPKSLTPDQRRQIERAVKSAKIDVNTGKDDRTLRRLALVLDLDVPADAQAKAGGLTTGKITFVLTIADLNKAQTIKAPVGAKPLSALTSQLQSLLGSGSGGTTGSSSSGSGSSSGTSTTPGAGGSGAPAGAPKKYLDCLQAAGQDVAAVQKCADLLTG